MNINRKNEKIRWQVIVSMLEEFPALKKKLENYLKTSGNKKTRHRLIHRKGLSAEP